MDSRKHRCGVGPTSSVVRAELASRSAIVALVSLVVTAALTLAACGGSSNAVADSPMATPAGDGLASPTTTSSAAAAPQRLVGDDSVAVTSRVVDGQRAALHEPTIAKFARIYAPDVVFDDYCYGVHGEGQAVALNMFRKNLREYTDARWIAGYAGHGWAAIEEYWDFTKTYGASITMLALCETRDGKVVREGDYLQAFQNLPGSRPVEPAPLKSPPGADDTAVAAKDAALRYSAALQTKDASAMAAVSAPSVLFLDTASSAKCSDPSAVQAHYAAIFTAPEDLAFTNLRYAFGRGWAVIIWTAASRSLALSGEGATMLEIRGGKIARETLYYNSAKVPFSAASG